MRPFVLTCAAPNLLLCCSLVNRTGCLQPACLCSRLHCLQSPQNGTLLLCLGSHPSSSTSPSCRSPSSHPTMPGEQPHASCMLESSHSGDWQFCPRCAYICHSVPASNGLQAAIVQARRFGLLSSLELVLSLPSPQDTLPNLGCHEGHHARAARLDQPAVQPGCWCWRPAVL